MVEKIFPRTIGLEITKGCELLGCICIFCMTGLWTGLFGIENCILNIKSIQIYITML
jgi:hypothetical protein